MECTNLELFDPVIEDGPVEDPEVPLCHQLSHLRLSVLWSGDGAADDDQEVRALVTGQRRTVLSRIFK